MVSFNCMPHCPLPSLPPGQQGGGLDLVLNETHTRRVENLTLGLIKSPHNCLLGWMGDLQKLTFPNGRTFKLLLAQIPTHCPKGMRWGRGGLWATQLIAALISLI